MLSARRRQYLESIGIDMWVRRAREVPAAAAGELPGAVGSAAVADGDAAPEWQRLLDDVRHCTLCPLHATRTQGVLGVGPKRADWLVIGEAPGAEEDRRGEPFVGAAGQLLDAMLRAIGLHRQRAEEPPAEQPRSQARGSRGLPAVPAAADCAAAAQDHAGSRADRGPGPAADGRTPRSAPRPGASLWRAAYPARSHVSSRLPPAYAGREAQGVGGPQVCPQRVPATDTRR